MDKLMIELRDRLLPSSLSPDDVNYGNTFNATTRQEWLVDERNLCLRVLLCKLEPGSGEDDEEVSSEQGDVYHYEYTLLDDTSIISYSIDENGTGEGFAVGSVASASYTLVIDNTNHNYQTESFVNTDVAVAIGIKQDGHTGIDFEPFGVWSILEADCQEQSSVATLRGLDALGIYYDGNSGIVYSEGTIYDQFQSMQELIDYMTYVDPTSDYDSYLENKRRFDWQIQYSHDYNNQIANFLSRKPAQKLYITCGKNIVTKRDVLSWAATTLGSYARIKRDGTFSFIALGHENLPSVESFMDIYYRSQNRPTFGPEKYISLNIPGTDKFTYKGLRYYVMNETATGEKQYEQGPLDGWTPQHIIELNDANPLIEMTDASGINTRLSSDFGAPIEPLTLSINGAPQIFALDWLRVSDLKNELHYFVVTSMSTTYNGGLLMTIACELPSVRTIHGSSFGQNSTLLSSLQANMSGDIGDYYSTDEVATGYAWINHNPMYRKVIELGSVPSGTTVDLSDLNFEFIRWEFAFQFTFGSTSNIQWSTTYYYGSNDYAMVYIKDNDMILRIANNIHLINAWIILEYTKQTS